MRFSRLLKNTHLLRFPRPSSLQRTYKYASLLRISGALHLDIFKQPYKQLLFQQTVRHLQSIEHLLSTSLRVRHGGRSNLSNQSYRGIASSSASADSSQSQPKSALTAGCLLLTFLILIFVPLPVWAKAVARIAVLPFEINSPGNPDVLRDEVIRKISSQFEKNKLILLTDRRTLSKVLLELQVSSYTAESLRQVADKTGANFILFGSLTQFNRSFSLDYYLYNNFEDIALSKNFIEGSDIEGLAIELVKKVSREVQDLAEDIPPAQAPTEAEGEGGIKEENLEEPLPSLPAGEIPKEEILTEPHSQASPEEKPKETVVASIPQDKGEGEAKEKPSGKKAGGALGSFQPSDKPVHITADSLEADNTRGMAVFKGNVVARQEDMVIFSDTMAVNYDEKGGMKQITATGNVKITRGDRVATGQKVVFYNPEQKIVLTGNPRVWQGADVISGERITIFVKENRSIVEGSKDKRVSATIYPKTKEEEKR